MLPKARKDKLTIRELADETLVYDLERNKAHCLNPTSAFIWRHCDGRTTLPKLAALVEKELGIPEGSAVVRLALEQLSGRNLLQNPVTPLTGVARLSRRNALRKLAVAAAAIPLVMTITAKKAAASGPVKLSELNCTKQADHQCFQSCSNQCSPKSPNSSCLFFGGSAHCSCACI